MLSDESRLSAFPGSSNVISHVWSIFPSFGLTKLGSTVHPRLGQVLISESLPFATPDALRPGHQLNWLARTALLGDDLLKGKGRFAHNELSPHFLRHVD
jgi:hypothetical protein